MLYAILIFFSFVESVIGFTLMSASTMRFREPVKKRVAAALLVMLIGVSILLYTLFTRGIYSVDGFAIAIILAIELAWFLICSDDTFFVSLFSFLSVVNIYVSTSYIGRALVITWLEYIIVRMPIYGTIILLLFKFVRPRFRQLVDALDREWRAATLVPLIFLILQIFVLYYPTPYWHWESNNWNKFIIIAVYMLFLAVYYLLYIQAAAIVKKYSLEKRELLMAQQNKLWESELVRQKDSVALAAQQRHDMHHHNAVIVGMLRSGDTKGLNAYMDSFNGALNEQNGSTFCINPIVNSLLNHYAGLAEEEGIKTAFHVILAEGIGIDNIDLTCVFGNILENALEGCLRLPEGDEKEINVTAKFIDNRLRVQVENTCPLDIVFAGELPVTQKKGGGTGIKSILYTAERYDGTAGFMVRDGKFITQIVLNAH